MSFRYKKGIALVMTAALGFAALTGCGQAKLNGKETALTVNGEAVTAGTVSFEAHYEGALFYSYYSSYFGGSGYFDLDAGNEEGTTIGEETVKTTANTIADEVILKQHAAEFGAELTDEQKSKIDEIAQGFIDKNDKEVIKKFGVSKEDIVYSMTLDTIRSNMLEPMAADVDTEVTDEEAQQTSVTYVSADAATEAAEDGTSAEDQNAAIKADLEEILGLIKESENVASADIRTIVSDFNDDYNAVETYFSTNDEEQETVDKAIARAVKNLEDGELYEGVIESEDGSRYFLVRLDKTFDETATNNRKMTIVSDRKQAHYDELLAGWKEEAEIVIKDDVLAKIKITDAEPYTFKAPESTEESSEESSEG